jgi:hypothetical protein
MDISTHECRVLSAVGHGRDISLFSAPPPHSVVRTEIPGPSLVLIRVHSWFNHVETSEESLP